MIFALIKNLDILGNITCNYFRISKGFSFRYKQTSDGSTLNSNPTVKLNDIFVSGAEVVPFGEGFLSSWRRVG